MTAPEIHSAFRGRLVCLLVLRIPGSNLCLPPAEVSMYFLRWNGIYILLPLSFIHPCRQSNQGANTNILSVVTSRQPGSCCTKKPNGIGIM